MGERWGKAAGLLQLVSIRKRLQTEGKVSQQGQEEGGEGVKRTGSGVETRSVGTRKGRYQESGMSEISVLFFCTEIEVTSLW